jgi:hypothetical protein
MQKTPKRSRFMQPIALAVATGSTIKDAAETAGCSLPVAYSLSRSPEFKQEVSEIRRQALQQAVGTLSNASHVAAACLVELMRDEDPKVRLAAASKLLDKLTPLTELHDLRQEIQELRELMSQRLKVAK